MIDFVRFLPGFLYLSYSYIIVAPLADRPVGFRRISRFLLPWCLCGAYADPEFQQLQGMV